MALTSNRSTLARLLQTLPVVAALIAGCARGSLQSKDPQAGAVTSPMEWTAYGHDAQGTKYSPARQITRENVGTLRQVWSYRTGDFALGDGAARDETTSLFVDGVLYASTPFGGVRALDPRTGTEIWAFDPELDLSGSYGDFTNRGVSTWVDPARDAAAVCHRRIYVAPVDARLIALDARTGSPCVDFGKGGQVDLNRDLVNAPAYAGEYEITSPPAIVNGLAIVGSTVADGQRASAPSGLVRAFDARSGALKWAWDPVARIPGDSGYDTWRGTSAHTTGAANAWSLMSVDSARDLLFVPTGSASPDFFGGERLGQNLYANSIVALRASTGKLVWHFQVVHHDLWDYDVPAQPVLFTAHRGGKAVPAVAQATKMGHLFILNRETGEPLFPVEERPVPASDVPGEQAWPTQPFPTLPRPLVPARFDTATVFGVNDAERSWCRQQLAGVRSEGIFTPPSLKGTVIFPGNFGGSNWSGIALDPVRRLAIVPSNRIITVVDLIPRADVHARAMNGSRFDEFAPQTGTSYGMRRRFMIAPGGVPCNQPPWGTLTAVDLESGEVRWERPLGRIASLAGLPASEQWGSPNIGGAMTTASGLVFIGGAADERLRAYDVETGKELWSAQLPAGVHATPMTYIAADGQQYIVVAAGGHKEFHASAGDFDKLGDYIVAFALPSLGRAASPNASGVTGGHYEGHIILDRTRLPMSWDLIADGSRASVALVTSGIRIEGQGEGDIRGDTLDLNVRWTFPAKKCSGTLHLAGTPANYGAALIGELSYVDGCTDGKTKPGTFAVWRGARHLTRVAK